MIFIKQLVLTSVIIPIYNIEKYLTRSIDSIVNQRYSNLEIICVDDGSTDHSLEIIQSLAKRDSRIRIIKQKNQGAGVARNNGLRYATGKYVIFLDADDYFDRNLIKKLVEHADYMQSEVCICKAFAVQENGKKVEMNYSNTIFKRYKNKVFSAQDIAPNILTSFSVEPWNKLYRRDFLLQLGVQFQALRKTNDLYFTSVTLINAKKIAVVDEKLVYYRTNNRQKIISYFDKKLLNFSYALVSTYRYIVQEDDLVSFKKSYFKMATGVIFYNLTLPMHKTVRKQIIDYLLNDNIEFQNIFKYDGQIYLDYMDRLQYWLLLKGASGTVQRLAYKVFKLHECIVKNGVLSTIKKMTSYYI